MLVVLIILALFAIDGHCGDSNKHFLSVFTRFRNEEDAILEFVQHYLEEGVDHFFMYNDRSADATVEALRCIPSNIYDIFTNDTIGVDFTQYGSKIPLDILFGTMYEVARIGDVSEWIIVVDIDEFITSRNSPHLSIKQIVQQSIFNDCGVIAIPGLVYSWGGLTHTPRNNARFALNYRWGYDEKFAVNVTEHSTFRNRHTSTRNSFIIKTSAVTDYRGVYHTNFKDSALGGNVCIPREKGPMSCAAPLTESRVQSYGAVKQSPGKNRGYYFDLEKKNDDLPRWCPFSNKFTSTQIPQETLLREDDVASMALLTFHYRIRSIQDWNRKSMYKRGRHGEANRLDVFDDFMTSTRRPAKENHPDYLHALKVVSSCPSTFYDKENLVPAIATQPVSDRVQGALNESDSSPPPHVLLKSYVESSLEYEFFFSVMVFARDESGVILELMRHYIEEGADHIFLFDDDSEDGMGDEALACIDPKYYTVYSRATFGSERRYSQQEGYMKMYIDMQVRHRTKWLAVVDADEFISSRATPHLTVRELLKSNLADCGIVSIPWILFSWGNQTHDPQNQFRDTLFYRMGYDEQYDMHAADDFKFRERWNGESNKVIFQTSKVSEYKLTHNARFTDEENGGLVCIPSTDTMLKCASDIEDKLDLDAFRAAVVKPEKVFEDIHGNNQSLPAYCPYSTRFIGVRSTYRTYINEQDIPKLLLGCFHYRVKSQDDWNRKTLGQRFNAWEYDDQYVKYANRLDVYDDFMVSVRKPARENHADYMKAAAMFQKCPSKYFGVQTQVNTETQKESVRRRYARLLR